MSLTASGKTLTLILTACLFLTPGCGKNKKEKEDPSVEKMVSDTSSKNTSSKQGLESGFSEMAVSAMQQAATQGLQIDLSNKDALARLIRTYLVRSDLQKAFGTPEKLNLSALIHWGAQYGITIDHDKSKLTPYANNLAAMASITVSSPVFVTLE